MNREIKFRAWDTGMLLTESDKARLLKGNLQAIYENPELLEGLGDAR